MKPSKLFNGLHLPLTCIALIFILFLVPSNGSDSARNVSRFDREIPAYDNPDQASLSSPLDEFQSEIGAGDASGIVEFVDEVSDGQAGIPRGVYVGGVLQLPIVQQPEGNPLYVSTEPESATLYRSATEYGVIGLLAHNYLSGELFYNLAIGQRVQIVYGDRAIRSYKVTGIRRFQKLTPADPYSDFLDLSSGEKLTSSQVFNLFYWGSEHVTFQTCLYEDGIWSWGLFFVVASPVNNLN